MFEVTSIVHLLQAYLTKPNTWFICPALVFVPAVPIDSTAGIKMLYVFVDIQMDNVHFLDTVKYNFPPGQSLALVSTIQFVAALQVSRLFCVYGLCAVIMYTCIHLKNDNSPSMCLSCRGTHITTSVHYISLSFVEAPCISSSYSTKLELPLFDAFCCFQAITNVTTVIFNLHSCPCRSCLMSGSLTASMRAASTSYDCVCLLWTAYMFASISLMSHCV